MKPAKFAYLRPTSLSEMLSLLDQHGDEAKILAGGQSLVAIMNFRLARPSLLIDANRLTELSRVESDGKYLTIGALTRHAAFHKPVTDHPIGHLLSRIVHHIAHYPIRNRGTFGGSLCHADPASEWCLTASVLDAEMIIESKSGKRVVPANEFFMGTFSTTLQPNELLTHIRVPLGNDRIKGGFNEFSRRAGDFALAMALVTLECEGSRIVSARVGLGGVAEKPVRLSGIEKALIGQTANATTFRPLAAQVSELITPTSDIHGTSEYRKDLIKAVLTRALAEASP